MSGRDEAVRAKSAPALRAAIEAAGPDDQVRAMLVLVAAEADTAAVDPAAFPNRAAYRKAVQRERAASAARQFAPLATQLDALQAEGLDVRRDPGSAVVVVEGPPELVASAVAHRQVESATLDAALTHDDEPSA